MNVNFLVWLFILISYLILLIVYIGYPLLLHYLPNKKPGFRNEFNGKTKIFHIIPMYNESAVLKAKILNSLEINFEYPAVTIFILDESNDGSDAILKFYADEYPDRIMFINKGYRGGKNDSINVAVEKVKPDDNDILFFSDANTFFEPEGFSFLLKKLEEGCGLVGGSMSYYDESSGTAISEGLYWKYEEWIRRNEAKIGRCIVVNGGNFALLAKHYKKLPLFVPNDLEAPLRLCGEGVYVGFCSEAIGTESAIIDDKEEWNRKKRMGNRQMNCISYLWSDLDFLTRMHITIRKILRWCGYHILLINLIFSVVFGMISFHQFSVFFVLGIAGIFIIFVTWICYSIGIKNRFIVIFIHAIRVHTSAFEGMMSSIKGKRVSIWGTAKSNR